MERVILLLVSQGQQVIQLPAERNAFSRSESGPGPAKGKGCASHRSGLERIRAHLLLGSVCPKCECLEVPRQPGTEGGNAMTTRGDSIEELTSVHLDNKWRANLDRIQYANLTLRLRRATSWLGRAEDEINKAEADADAGFLFCWIAFNSVYAEHQPETYDFRERDGLRKYFAKIVRLDQDNVIYDAIWTRFSGPVRVFLDNRYVFRAFWTSDDWESQLQSRSFAVRNALATRNTAVILNELFERLYVLRNQIVHGGATWRGQTNRDQVRDGQQIMAFTVPRFINIMIDNPDEDWGLPHYPPSWHSAVPAEASGQTLDAV